MLLDEDNFWMTYMQEMQMRIFALRALPFEARALLLNGTLHEMISCMRQQRLWVGARGGLAFDLDSFAWL